MNGIDMGKGGGYDYQWECAILLALNYLIDQMDLDPKLDTLVNDFLGRVTEIQLEGEDPDQKDLWEDINLIADDKCILIQVKTMERGLWSLGNDTLHKALYRFYNSSILKERPSNVRFVFLTNRPFDDKLMHLNHLLAVKDFIESNEAKDLFKHLEDFANKPRVTTSTKGKAAPSIRKVIDQEKFEQMLSKTTLVDYISEDQLRGVIKAYLKSSSTGDLNSAHALLYERFKHLSIQKGGGKVTTDSLREILESGPDWRWRVKNFLRGILKSPKKRETQISVKEPRSIPSLSPGFVSREEDLKELDRKLREYKYIGIVGAPGVGKTQLAVKYWREYKEKYPGGVFWLNAANPLRSELADYADVDPGVCKDEAARSMKKYFERNPQSLVIVDDIPDPKCLNSEFIKGLTFSQLKCTILFTTACREFPPNLTPFELQVLPDEAALEFLLRNHRKVRDPDDPEHSAAVQIVKALGGLPLALKLAAAYLEKSKVPLENYLATLHEYDVSDSFKFKNENPATRHTGATEAVLNIQWNGLKDPNAKQLFLAAGQLPETSLIPTERLGLFCAFTNETYTGDMSLLGLAIEELESFALLEKLPGDRLLLHLLVHGFARSKGDAGLRSNMVGNLARAFGDMEDLDSKVKQDRVDEVLGDLFAGIDLLNEDLEGQEEFNILAELKQVLELEAHNFHGWDLKKIPGFCLQQIAWQSHQLGMSKLAQLAENCLQKNGWRYIQFQWKDLSPSSTQTEVMGTVVAVAVNLGRKQVVSAYSDGTLRKCSLDYGKFLHDQKVPLDGGTIMAQSAKGPRMLSALEDGTLQLWDWDGELWDLEGITLSRTMEGHTGPVFAATLSEDGQQAVSASWDHTLRVWDLEKGVCLRCLEGHTGPVHAMALSETEDGRSLVSASHDGTLCIWDLGRGNKPLFKETLSYKLTTVAFSRNGQRFITGSSSGDLWVWDLKSRRSRRLGGHASWIRAIHVTSDGQRAVSASVDGNLRVWDLKKLKELNCMRIDSIAALELAPDDQHIIVVDERGNIYCLKLWEPSESYRE